MACLALRTRPEDPFPIVFPKCHGPTCVFRRLGVPEVPVDAVEI